MDANTRTRESGGPSGQQSRPDEDRAKRSNEPERAAGSATAEAQRSVQKTAADTQETLQRAGDAARQGMQDVTANLAEQTRRTTRSLKDALDVHRGTVQTATEDIKAATAAASASAEGFLTIETALVDWAEQNVESVARISQRMLGSRTPRELTDAQGEFADSMMKSWMEGNATILRATQELAGRALGPVTERVQQRTSA